MNVTLPPAPSVEMHTDAAGNIHLRCPFPLPPVRQSLAHLFDEVAELHPERLFMCEPDGKNGWLQMRYAEARRAADGLAQWLIDQNLGLGDYVSYLAGPSIQHGIAMVGVQRCGAAIAPVSVGYALVATEFTRLYECVAAIKPRVIIVDDALRFAPALRAIKDLGAIIVAATGTLPDIDVVPWATVIATVPTPTLRDRMNAIQPTDIARIMYTSGSTGSPKATPQTHANLTITVAQSEALGLLTFDGAGPQLLEAMPFSHIMAGNFNFANIVSAGGTIWIDDGKPTPQLFHRTLANLQTVSPDYFITVPLGWALLCDALEKDSALRDRFFKNLRWLGFGGAVLNETVQDRLLALSNAARGHEIPFYSFYGATEYLFGALKYWKGGPTNIIGLPLPTADLKLVAAGDCYEMRIKGPTLMPKSGYINAPEASAHLFDEEGYFFTGDAVRFADPDDPLKGLVFAGRISEDFKLSSGTYVLVSELYNAVMHACSDVVTEIVLCGLNEDYIAALIWATRGTGVPELKARLAAFNATQSGSARRIKRFILVEDPLSFDAGELTVKGNCASRVVRSRRADLVARLFASNPDREVITVPAI